MTSKRNRNTKPKSEISKSLKAIAELAALKDSECIAQLGQLEDSLDKGYRYRLCMLFESKVEFEQAVDHLELFEATSEASVFRVEGNLLVRISFGSNEDVRAFQLLSRSVFWNDVLRGFGEFCNSEEAGWIEVKETKVISNQSKLPVHDFIGRGDSKCILDLADRDSFTWQFAPFVNGATRVMFGVL